MSEARVDKTEYSGPKRARTSAEDEENKDHSASEETDEEFEWYDGSMDDGATAAVVVNDDAGAYGEGSASARRAKKN